VVKYLSREKVTVEARDIENKINKRKMAILLAHAIWGQ